MTRDGPDPVIGLEEQSDVEVTEVAGRIVFRQRGAEQAYVAVDENALITID